MNRKHHFIILISIVFYTSVFIMTWHMHWRWKANISLTFSTLFYLCFGSGLYGYLSQYLKKKRTYLSSLFWGSFLGLALGVVVWFVLIFCFTDLRNALLTGWHNEESFLAFLTWRIFVSTVITAHVLIGGLSSLTANWLIQQFNRPLSKR